MNSTQQWVPELDAAEQLTVSKATLRTMRRDGRLDPGAHWIYATGTIHSPVLYDLSAIRKTMAERTVQMVQDEERRREEAIKARKAAIENYGDDGMDRLIAEVQS